jgi:hypothetical protein
LAQSAPPELAADALLRVAASERNQERAWKIELLEDSFQMAVLARQPNRPSLRNRQCREALVDHVAEYYELVAEQRHRGGHVDPASYPISRISSPVEVGPDREKVLHRLVAFLRSSSLQQESALEWYAQANHSVLPRHFPFSEQA